MCPFFNALDGYNDIYFADDALADDIFSFIYYYIISTFLNTLVSNVSFIPHF